MVIFDKKKDTIISDLGATSHLILNGRTQNHQTLVLVVPLDPDVLLDTLLDVD